MRCHIWLSQNFPRAASARYVFQFFAEMADFIESDEESENLEGFNNDGTCTSPQAFFTEKVLLLLYFCYCTDQYNIYKLYSKLA